MGGQGQSCSLFVHEPCLLRGAIRMAPLAEAGAALAVADASRSMSVSIKITILNRKLAERTHLEFARKINGKPEDRRNLPQPFKPRRAPASPSPSSAASPA